MPHPTLFLYELFYSFLFIQYTFPQFFLFLKVQELFLNVIFHLILRPYFSTKSWLASVPSQTFWNFSNSATTTLWMYTVKCETIVIKQQYNEWKI